MRDRYKARRKNWRQGSIRAAARRYGAPGGRHRLKHGLLAVLALELVVGAGQYCRGQGMHLRVVRQEESCLVEWVLPDEAVSRREEERYGVRVSPDTWELQFYHTRENLREPEEDNPSIKNH